MCVHVQEMTLCVHIRMCVCVCMCVCVKLEKRDDRSGYVYVFSPVLSPNVIKCGQTAQDPSQRFQGYNGLNSVSVGGMQTIHLLKQVSNRYVFLFFCLGDEYPVLDYKNYFVNTAGGYYLIHKTDEKSLEHQ